MSGANNNIAEVGNTTSAIKFKVPDYINDGICVSYRDEFIIAPEIRELMKQAINKITDANFQDLHKMCQKLDT